MRICVSFVVVGFLGTVSGASLGSVARVIDVSSTEEPLTPTSIIGEASRRAPVTGFDLETFTKNAAIRTNQENALLQQLAFRRNQLLTTRDASNKTNALTTEIANNDLLNALVLPSAAGHGTSSFGFPGIAQSSSSDRDRLLFELMEQNRRQQIEIQRLVQQNMINHGRPVMPFNPSEAEMAGFPTELGLGARFGGFEQNPRSIATAQQQADQNSGNMGIMNTIRTVTANGLANPAQITSTPGATRLTPNDMEFLRRQLNPFEAPLRMDQQQQQQQQQQFLRTRQNQEQQQQQQQNRINSNGGFFEEVTDAFGRRIPFLRDPAIDQNPEFLDRRLRTGTIRKTEPSFEMSTEASTATTVATTTPILKTSSKHL
uniref:Uncharacterized protein n=1 Tax=Panagrellus redivivus TaxID=6233 RepID=A0A7E4V3K4_PANRE